MPHLPLPPPPQPVEVYARYDESCLGQLPNNKARNEWIRMVSNPALL